MGKMGTYDVSKNFSGNQKANIKDEFDFSPEKNEAYNYKAGINATHNLMGEMMEPKYEGQKSPRELSMESKNMKKGSMGRMESDREGY